MGDFEAHDPILNNYNCNNLLEVLKKKRKPLPKILLPRILTLNLELYYLQNSMKIQLWLSFTY